MSAELHVVMKVEGGEYVVPAAEVLHLDAYEGATPVPGAPGFVAGLVQIRRKVVPVVDLRARFGLPAIAPSLQSRVVVVQAEGRAVGLLVDSAREVVKLEPAQFQPPPEVVARQAEGFVQSVAQAGDRLLLLLDFRKVIGEEVLHGDR